MKKNDLSVVVLMYNKEEMIARTIAALTDELNPLGIEWELVLVNDGSTDRTVGICRRENERDRRIKVEDIQPKLQTAGSMGWIMPR